MGTEVSEERDTNGRDSEPGQSQDESDLNLLPASVGVDIYGHVLSPEERSEVSRNLLGLLSLLLEIDAERGRTRQSREHRQRVLRRQSKGSKR